MEITTNNLELSKSLGDFKDDLNKFLVEVFEGYRTESFWMSDLKEADVYNTVIDYALDIELIKKIGAEYRLTASAVDYLEKLRERQRLEQEKEEQNSQAFREISKQLEDAGKALEVLEEHAKQVRIILERIQLLQRSVAEYNKATKGGDDGKLK